jgi:5-methylcytosine-specific restriction endonuclease McrA
MNVLTNKVLVLNKSWAPTQIVSLKRAMKKVFGDENQEPKALIIDPYAGFQTYNWADWAALTPREDEKVIRSAHAVHKIPEVILLTEYDKVRSQCLRFSRRQIYRRDNHQCQYCGKKPGSEELSLDHVLPKSKGGLTTWENCVLACIECNSRKADKTLSESRMIIQGWKPEHKRKLPCKPKYDLLKGEIKVKIPESWKNFLSEVYWEITLENDNDE